MPLGLRARGDRGFEPLIATDRPRQKDYRQDSGFARVSSADVVVLTRAEVSRLARSGDPFTLFLLTVGAVAISKVDPTIESLVSSHGPRY